MLFRASVEIRNQESSEKSTDIFILSPRQEVYKFSRTFPITPALYLLGKFVKQAKVREIV